jgi:hypothetical protein
MEAQISSGVFRPLPSQEPDFLGFFIFFKYF